MKRGVVLCILGAEAVRPRQMPYICLLTTVPLSAINGRRGLTQDDEVWRTSRIVNCTWSKKALAIRCWRSSGNPARTSRIPIGGYEGVARPSDLERHRTRPLRPLGRIAVTGDPD